MTRLRILRDQLGSGGMNLLYQTHSLPDDGLLNQWFGSLHVLEKKHDVTLYPLQLVVVGCQPSLRRTSLNLFVQTEAERECCWHGTLPMVSHHDVHRRASQDTGINLVDIAVPVREGLGANTILDPEQYDNDNNRLAIVL
jgi:hypothetical protein